MTARSDLAEALSSAVATGAAAVDDADRFGPPAFVFRSPYVRGVRFELRPIDRPPGDKWVGLMYRRTAGTYRQAGVGVFRDGVFRNDRRKLLQGDLFWSLMVEEAAGG